MTTGKTIALTRRTFVGKVMSLLFNLLSRLVITFLPRSKHLLISCLESPSAVILELRKTKSDTVSTVSPSISHEVRNWGQEEKGTTEDEIAGWHHRLNGHEFQWTPGVGDGQRGLECCNSWGCKAWDTTERLKWTELNWTDGTGCHDLSFLNVEL